MTNQEDLITVTQARKLLGISSWKMADLLKRGELSFTTTAWDKRKKLLRKADVEAWKELAGPRVEGQEDANVTEKASSHVQAAA